MRMLKYPRTAHIEGSRLQPGDEDLDSVPFDVIAGRWIVVTEKLDGANAGLRFNDKGDLFLQSRGHFLTGGVREKHFAFFKQWAGGRSPELWPILSQRYAVYGEWLYAKHTVFYDQLPHYFLEFDLLDLETEQFLSSAARQQLLTGSPIFSAPILYAGPARTLEHLLALVGPSRYKGPAWRERLVQACAARGIGPAQAWKETDTSDLMEGLYIKVEEAGRVVERYKYVRAGFLTVVVDSGTHWLRRPIVPNELRDGADLFGGAP